jgi:AbrB family looped-hinge helix DNA binding protein
MNVQLSKKGWVVIPATLRAKYGLKPGASLQVVDYGGVLALIPAHKNPIQDGEGMLQDGASLTQALVKERREEYKRDSH